MSMLGLVLGFMCLGGAYYNAKIWWTMGDDKAGFNGDDVSRGAMLVNSGFLLWNCYLFVLNGWYGVIGICLQVGLIVWIIRQRYNHKESMRKLGMWKYDMQRRMVDPNG